MSKCVKITRKTEGVKGITLDKGLQFGGLKIIKSVNACIVGTTFLLVLKRDLLLDCIYPAGKRVERYKDDLARENLDCSAFPGRLLEMIRLLCRFRLCVRTERR